MQAVLQENNIKADPWIESVRLDFDGDGKTESIVFANPRGTKTAGGKYPRKTEEPSPLHSCCGRMAAPKPFTAVLPIIPMI